MIKDSKDNEGLVNLDTYPLQNAAITPSLSRLLVTFSANDNFSKFYYFLNGSKTAVTAWIDGPTVRLV